MKRRTNRKAMDKDEERVLTLEYLDMIAPSIIEFRHDYYVMGNTFRCVWALREYPTSTEEQALLRHLGERAGVTLHIYTRVITPNEERRIIKNAEQKNHLSLGTGSGIQNTVQATENLQDVATLVSSRHRNREPMFHTAVYIELVGNDLEALKELQISVMSELNCAKLCVDKLLLQQREGLQAVMPSGYNRFGQRYERVLPASSVANLYPLCYSGKTDPHGIYLGRDKFGSNVIIDLDRRTDDRTNSNILILGNSGQGKSFLLKTLLCNILESGKNVLVLDPELEYTDLARNLGGSFIDLMSGEYIINPLEPKLWEADHASQDKEAPQTFRQSSRLGQHISFLRDFFASYKEFTDSQIDIIELMVERLYVEYGITDQILPKLATTDYPTLSALYELMEKEYQRFDGQTHPLYTADNLREILLGLHSMCLGTDSRYFNGHTNIGSGRFTVFGCKALLQASKNLVGTMLFNILSFMSNALLTQGNTYAAIDELYLFLDNKIAISYIRAAMKRARKKQSGLVLASQNLEDFTLPDVAEYTKPLFSIPTHQFLFNAGSIDPRIYMDTLQLEHSEYALIRYPQRGVCLYKCGNERYNLCVDAPIHKRELFGAAGGV